jgi:hypothetical protein
MRPASRSENTASISENRHQKGNGARRFIDRLPIGGIFIFYFDIT